MKRTIAILIFMLFVLSLCACGNKETFSNNEAISNNLATEAEKYVGTTWVTANQSNSFKFLPESKVIWVDHNYDGVLVTDCSYVFSGEWLIENNQIIIFFDVYNGNNGTMLFELFANTFSYPLRTACNNGCLTFKIKHIIYLFDYKLLLLIL